MLRSALLIFLAISVAACGGAGTEREAPPATSAPRPASPPRTETRPATKPPGTPRIIVLGDSLTAGLGLPIEQSFPSLIQARLDREGYQYEVVNAGVSGDTSAGGMRRLEWALGEGNPQILIVALGGNDGLRGLPPPELEKNLSDIIERGQRQKLTVVLTGMEAPPNYGEDYTAAFRKTYRTLAEKYRVTFVPFLLEGVAGDPALNQGDGIHPNARGAQKVADLVWNALQPALTRTSQPSR